MLESELINVNSDCLYHIALCHSIIIEKTDKGELLYNASSPDELALVNFARYVGFEYRGTDMDSNLIVGYNGKQKVFKLLHLLEFNSTR